MPIHCRSCGSTDLRLSRFRMRDLPHLLIFRYPMRCWVCRERDYLPMLRILKIVREAHLQADGTLSDEKMHSG